MERANSEKNLPKPLSPPVTIKSPTSANNRIKKLQEKIRKLESQIAGHRKEIEILEKKIYLKIWN